MRCTTSSGLSCNMDATKETNKLLSSYAYSSGDDFANVFDKWLDWIIGWFDPQGIRSRQCDFVNMMAEMQSDNETFYECFSLVAQDTASNIEQRGWHDAFGSLYEEKVKSGYKASSMGQFFTPEGLCDALAQITLGEKHGSFVYDPACGSGRLPLAIWGHIDKDKFTYFVMGDLDPLSCKMSALNMMLHGMFGIVERRNALTLEFFGGYVVNEMCYPFPIGVPSIRRADELECRKNFEYARAIAPKDDDGHEQPALKIEPPVEPQAEPRQLSLFNLDEL